MSRDRNLFEAALRVLLSWIAVAVDWVANQILRAELRSTDTYYTAENLAKPTWAPPPL